MTYCYLEGQALKSYSALVDITLFRTMIKIKK